MRLFNRSLSKIIKVSIVFIIISIALLNFIPLSIEKSHREREMQASLQNALHVQETYITKWTEERLLNMETLASLPVVKALDFEKMLSVFQPFVEKNEDFLSLVYVNKDGIATLDTGGDINTVVNLSDREYFIEGQKGNAYVSEVIMSRNTGLPIITFSHPVYDEDEEFQGIIFAPVSLETINHMINNLNIGKTGKLHLVDKNGQSITESIKGDIDLERKQMILEEQLAIAKVYERFPKYYNNINGLQVMGDYKWVNDDQWLIIAEIDKEEVLHPFYTTAFTLTSISLLVLIVAYVFMSQVNKRINEPIQHVLKGAKLIIEGQYLAYKIDKRAIAKTPIELQELCDIFNKMSETIAMNISEIKQSEEKLRTIISTAQDAIIITDVNMRIISWNKSAENIFGYKEDEIIGKTIDIIKPKHYLDRYYFSLEQFLSKGKKSITGKTVEFMGLRKDNTLIPIELSLNSWQVDDEIYFCGIIRDISKRKEDEKQLTEVNSQLKELSIRDGLTKIYNRRHFDDVFEQEWKHHLLKQMPLSIIMFDIDFFKKYNDTYGHLQGDHCLIKVATHLDNLLSDKGYIFARYGGEEFIVILQNTDQEKAKNVAEKIRTAVLNLQIPHEKSEVSPYLTVSVGVSTIIPNDEIKREDLLKKADEALYRGKEKGRNRVYILE